MPGPLSAGLTINYDNQEGINADIELSAQGNNTPAWMRPLGMNFNIGQSGATAAVTVTGSTMGTVDADGNYEANENFLGEVNGYDISEQNEASNRQDGDSGDAPSKSVKDAKSAKDADTTARQVQSGDDSSPSYIEGGLPVLLTLAAGAVSSVVGAFAGNAASPSVPQSPTSQGGGNVNAGQVARRPRKDQEGDSSPNSNNAQTSGNGDGANNPNVTSNNSHTIPTSSVNNTNPFNGNNSVNINNISLGTNSNNSVNSDNSTPNRNHGVNNFDSTSNQHVVENNSVNNNGTTPQVGNPVNINNTDGMNPVKPTDNTNLSPNSSNPQINDSGLGRVITNDLLNEYGYNRINSLENLKDKNGNQVTLLQMFDFKGDPLFDRNDSKQINLKFQKYLEALDANSKNVELSLDQKSLLEELRTTGGVNPERDAFKRLVDNVIRVNESITYLEISISQLKQSENPDLSKIRENENKLKQQKTLIQLLARNGGDVNTNHDMEQERQKIEERIKLRDDAADKKGIIAWIKEKLGYPNGIFDVDDVGDNLEDKEKSTKKDPRKEFDLISYQDNIERLTYRNKENETRIEILPGGATNEIIQEGNSFWRKLFGTDRTTINGVQVEDGAMIVRDKDGKLRAINSPSLFETGLNKIKALANWGIYNTFGSKDFFEAKSAQDKEIESVPTKKSESVH